MWYVLDAESDAKLYAGFNKKMNKKEYLNHFEKGEILFILIK